VGENIQTEKRRIRNKDDDKILIMNEQVDLMPGMKVDRMFFQQFEEK
jgi:hypothetical protein